MGIRILGIDPGSRITGYGIVEVQGQRIVAVDSGLIRVQGTQLAERLGYIFRRVQALVNEHSPDIVSVEQVFVQRNVDSALKLGQARGVAICACHEARLPVFEYTATQVKKALVGRGHADKAQVQLMVKQVLGLKQKPLADAADALACAICHWHHFQTQMRLRTARRA